MAHLIFVDPTTGTINEVNKDTFLLDLDQDDLSRYSDEDLLNAADNTRLTVIPLLENLSAEGELEESVANLRHAIKRIIAAWEGGDLAGAVNDAAELVS